MSDVTKFAHAFQNTRILLAFEVSRNTLEPCFYCHFRLSNPFVIKFICFFLASIICCSHTPFFTSNKKKKPIHITGFTEDGECAFFPLINVENSIEKSNFFVIWRSQLFLKRWKINVWILFEISKKNLSYFQSISTAKNKHSSIPSRPSNKNIKSTYQSYRLFFNKFRKKISRKDKQTRNHRFLEAMIAV